MIYTSVKKTMRAEETVRKRYTDAQVKSMQSEERLKKA